MFSSGLRLAIVLWSGEVEAGEEKRNTFVVLSTRGSEKVLWGEGN